MNEKPRRIRLSDLIWIINAEVSLFLMGFFPLYEFMMNGTPLFALGAATGLFFCLSLLILKGKKP
jgi:hypothetical protein